MISYCFVKNLLKTFTFPIEKKQQITNYLKKHIQEITEEIIRKSGE